MRKTNTLILPFVQRVDPDMIEQPPEYDERYTYDYEGIQHTRRPDEYSSMIREAGTGWTGRVKKVLDV